MEEREIAREEERGRRRADAKDRRFGHLAGHRRESDAPTAVSPVPTRTDTVPT